jgi:hypothetical protein
MSQDWPNNKTRILKIFPLEIRVCKKRKEMRNEVSVLQAMRDKARLQEFSWYPTSCAKFRTKNIFEFGLSRFTS